MRHFHTCILQSWPKRPTHQTTREPAPSSWTSRRQTVSISLLKTSSVDFYLTSLTLFSISVREKRKSNYMNHVSFLKNLLNAWLIGVTGVSPAKRLKLSSHLLQMSPGLLTKKYSSCSTIFIDDSTVSQPNLKSTIKWWLYLRLLNVVTEMVLHFKFWCPVFLEPAVFIWRL